MRLFLRIADTRMTSRKYLISLSLSVRSIELDFHKFVHVLHNHHVAVQLNNPVVFLQRERGEFAPAIVEARVVGEIFVNGGQEVLDSLLGYPTDIEGAVTFWRERIRVEGDEGVLRAILLKRIIKSE